MAHYDANEIIENIERTLEEQEAESSGLDEEERQSLFRETRLAKGERSLSRRLEKGPLSVMRQFQSVGSVPLGSRFRFVKRVMARMLKLFTGPQSAYNSENLEAMQCLCREMDLLRQRLKQVEDGPARPFAQAHMKGGEDIRIQNLVTQHLQQVQGNLDQVSGNLQGMSGALTQIVDNVSVVTNKMNSLGVKQQDVYTEVSSARLDVSRLWTELGLVYESIDKRAEDIWQGLDERDDQLMTTTEATQQLHSKVGSTEGALKELRARLLVLNEQLTIQQEMLEGLKDDVSSVPISRGANQVPRREAVPGRPQSEWEAPSEEETVPEDGGVKPMSTSGPMSMLHRQLDLAYLRFQRQFRGDESELRIRQLDYLGILEDNLKKTNPDLKTPVLLDVACGDGIFMELALQKGWDAKGVDLSELLVKQGASRNLEIELEDALIYLEKQEPASVDIISTFQFVEHLPPIILMKLLKLCFRVLRPQGLLLVETINPHTMMALHWYHLDLTHQRLVYPEMLEVLAETAGFMSVEWQGVNPVQDSDKLELIGDSVEKKNLDKLNKFLFGEQDYYYLARRPGSSVNP